MLLWLSNAHAANNGQNGPSQKWQRPSVSKVQKFAMFDAHDYIIMMLYVCVCANVITSKCVWFTQYFLSCFLHFTQYSFLRLLFFRWILMLLSMFSFSCCWYSQQLTICLKKKKTGYFVSTQPEKERKRWCFADKNGAFELILGSALIKMDALQPENIEYFVAFFNAEKKLLEFSEQHFEWNRQ